MPRMRAGECRECRNIFCVTRAAVEREILVVAAPLPSAPIVGQLIAAAPSPEILRRVVGGPVGERRRRRKNIFRFCPPHILFVGGTSPAGVGVFIGPAAARGTKRGHAPNLVMASRRHPCARTVCGVPRFRCKFDCMNVVSVARHSGDILDGRLLSQMSTFRRRKSLPLQKSSPLLRQTSASHFKSQWLILHTPHLSGSPLIWAF